MDIPSVFVWVILGALLQLLGFGRWMTPLAAWLAPVFLLHFTRSLEPLTGFLWVWLALTVAISISLRGIVPIPGPAYLVMPAIMGLFGALSLLVDKLVAPHLSGFIATLVYPVALTAVEFLNARLNPYGTWGATGYTQHGVLPLVQLASVTGIWGIGFLIGWFASVVNWAWDLQFMWGVVQNGVLVFAGIVSAILLWGGLRLARSPQKETVRIAGIGWPKGIIEVQEFMRAVVPDLSEEERMRLNVAFRRIQDSFLLRSEREAQAGAKIIVWPEANLIVLKEEEAAFLERARALVRDQQIHLVMGMATLQPGESHTFRNHAVMLTPTGETAYDYTKITSVPGFEKRYGVPGVQTIPFVSTEYGVIGSPICFDMDFEGIIRQLGRGSADLALVPASDWKEIMPLHQQMAEFRAIENGTALFRITRWGSSGAIDPYGRTLAVMDDFAAEDNVMVAQVPVKAGIRTLYAQIGNAFGWLCSAGLVVFLALMMI